MTNFIEVSDEFQKRCRRLLSISNTVNCLITNFCGDGHPSCGHSHQECDQSVLAVCGLEGTAYVRRGFLEVSDRCSTNECVEVIEAQCRMVQVRPGLAAEGNGYLESRRCPAVGSLFTVRIANYFKAAILLFLCYYTLSTRQTIGSSLRGAAKPLSGRIHQVTDLWNS